MFQICHALLQRLLIRFLDRIVQLIPRLGSDGMEGVHVLGFAIRLIGAEWHVDHDLIILFGDTNIVYREGVSDRRAGERFG